MTEAHPSISDAELEHQQIELNKADDFHKEKPIPESKRVLLERHAKIDRENETIKPVPITEFSIADNWVEDFGHEFIFNTDDDVWLSFRDGFWARNKHAAENSVKSTIERLCSGSVLQKFARHLRVLHTLGIARNRCYANASEFDANPNLLGVPGGVVDLSTSKLRGAVQSDMLTLKTSVQPNKRKPTKWLKFLDEALAGDDEMIQFLRASVKYWISASMEHQMFWIICGDSGTGKSTFISCIQSILGDYAITLSDKALSGNSHEHSTILAALEGKRLAVSSEVHGSLRGELIKRISGGDKISARRMRADAREFQPVCKIVMTSNELPSVPADNAIRRRIKLVPFESRPKKENPNLLNELKAEHGAILAWAISGKSLHEVGVPALVTSLSAEYVDSEDSFKCWLDECCVIDFQDVQHYAEFALLFESYQDYCRRFSVKPIGSRSFGDRLHRLGHYSDKRADTRVRLAIKLNADDHIRFTAKHSKPGH